MHPLTDAFWKGRALLKKEKGAYFDSEKKPKKACAIGAIHYGLFKKTDEPNSVVTNIFGDYSEIRKLVAVPCGCEDIGTVSAILIHLNDEHDGRTYPDTAIANWLEEALK